LYNQSDSPLAKELADKITHDIKKVQVGNRTYNIKIDLVNDPEVIYNPEQLVKNNEKDATIVIKKGFEQSVYSNLVNSLKDMKKLDLSTKTATKFWSKLNTVHLIPKLDFYNSYKHNFLTGEMTNFGASLLL
jgi:hypothetical protein